MLRFRIFPTRAIALAGVFFANGCGSAEGSESTEVLGSHAQPVKGRNLGTKKKQPVAAAAAKHVSPFELVTAKQLLALSADFATPGKKERVQDIFEAMARRLNVAPEPRGVPGTADYRVRSPYAVFAGAVLAARQNKDGEATLQRYLDDSRATLFKEWQLAEGSGDAVTDLVNSMQGTVLRTHADLKIVRQKGMDAALGSSYLELQFAAQQFANTYRRSPAPAIALWAPEEQRSFSLASALTLEFTEGEAFDTFWATTSQLNDASFLFYADYLLILQFVTESESRTVSVSEMNRDPIFSVANRTRTEIARGAAAALKREPDRDICQATKVGPVTVYSKRSRDRVQLLGVSAATDGQGGSLTAAEIHDVSRNRWVVLTFDKAPVSNSRTRAKSVLLDVPENGLFINRKSPSLLLTASTSPTDKGILVISITVFGQAEQHINYSEQILLQLNDKDGAHLAEVLALIEEFRVDPGNEGVVKAGNEGALLMPLRSFEVTGETIARLMAVLDRLEAPGVAAAASAEPEVGKLSEQFASAFEIVLAFTETERKSLEEAAANAQKREDAERSWDVPVFAQPSTARKGGRAARAQTLRLPEQAPESADHVRPSEAADKPKASETAPESADGRSASAADEPVATAGKEASEDVAAQVAGKLIGASDFPQAVEELEAEDAQLVAGPAAAGPAAAAVERTPTIEDMAEALVDEFEELSPAAGYRTITYRRWCEIAAIIQADIVKRYGELTTVRRGHQKGSHRKVHHAGVTPLHYVVPHGAGDKGTIMKIYHARRALTKVAQFYLAQRTQAH